jgi:hypothetical protein
VQNNPVICNPFCLQATESGKPNRAETVLRIFPDNPVIEKF